MAHTCRAAHLDHVGDEQRARIAELDALDEGECAATLGDAGDLGASAREELRRGREALHHTRSCQGKRYPLGQHEATGVDV